VTGVPSITNLSPASAPVGSAVTITGTGFGASQGGSTVKFYNNISAGTATAWSDTSITATVPSGATTGNVVVTVSSVASNTVSFTVGEAIYYYFTDALGSSRVMTTSAGTVCFDADYYPYGAEIAEYASSCASSYKFTGEERDPESGLDNFGARYMSSQFGRFMIPDPLGNFVADPTDPQTWNMYSYVTNNPLKYVDPDGYDRYLSCIDIWAEFLVLPSDWDTEHEYSPYTEWRVVGQSCNYEYENDPRPRLEAPPSQPRPTPKLEAGHDWFRSRQAQCVGEGLKGTAKDLVHFDLVDAAAGFLAGDFEPVGQLVSTGNAVSLAQTGANRVANNRSVVVAIREGLRSEGIRFSGNAIAKGAKLGGKLLAAAGAVLAAYSGYEAYDACMNN